MAFAPPFQRPFPAPFDRRAAAAAAGNGLLNALIAYWPGNEASGNALDLHTNGLTLTGNSPSIPAASGIVYATARNYGASTFYHYRNDETLVSCGDVDFTLAAWIYLNSLANTSMGKDSGGSGGREYMLGYNHAVTRYQWRVSDNGVSWAIVNADNYGAPASGAWHLLVGWHDAANNQIGISIDGGTPNTVAHTTGCFDGATPFRIGYVGTLGYSYGRIGPVAFWKSAAGNGGALTAAQRTALFNSGNGLAYTAFTT